jgi:hypothetical protein
MVFVADDLGAWLVGLLADIGRKRLATMFLGSEQQRALQQAATAAVQRTAEDISAFGGEQAEVAMVISEVFREAIPGVLPAARATLMETLQAAIATQLAVLDDAGLTGTGQSSAEVLGIASTAIAERLTSYLVQEILFRGSRGGPLTPLASQLNHDLSHLQGQRVEIMLARLVSEVQGTLAARKIASHPVRLAPRPAFLVGREELLADLNARLSSRGEQAPHVVTLYGLGGTGKTSVAVEYAHRRIAATGLVWQFPAEDPAALAAGFGELAVLLGAGEMLENADPISAVHAVLAARASEWLLIFDNALDAATVAGVLPPAGNGQVIITSQNPHWPGDQSIEVPVLRQGIAAEFVMARTGDGDNRAAWLLAEELGGLPLALEQAAAYMSAAGRDIAQYLDLYLQRRAEMLARGDPTGYDKRVTTTWSLAFVHLQKHSPKAIGLLWLLACCAPDAVPYRLLLERRPGLLEQLPSEAKLVLAQLLEDPLAVDDAIVALRHYSLISAPVGGTVSIHRLVQAITLTQLPEHHVAAWQKAVATLISAAMPDDPQQPANWPVYAALLPHTLAALSVASKPLAYLASYLGYSGSRAAARDLYRQVLNAFQEQLGSEHPDTLTIRADLAWWIGEAGDPAGARDQLAVLLPIQQRVSGPDHPQTLATRAHLAHQTAAAGDTAAARDQYAALLPIQQRVLGGEHPDTLTTRADLAHVTGIAGDAAGARDGYAALLPIRERVSGGEHPDTLTTRGNLARWTGEAGDPVSARDQFAALLPVFERVSGGEHPDTLTTRGSLARWAGASEDPAGARDQFAALLPVFERVSGPDHPQTLAVRANLAQSTGAAGDATAARDQFAALLPVFERVSGPDHPQTLAIRAILARWTGVAGDPAGARDQLAALLPLRERVLGAEHPDTQATRANLASWARQADSAGNN